LNHGVLAERNTLGQVLVQHLQAASDINQSTISAETVENDPTRVSSED